MLRIYYTDFARYFQITVYRGDIIVVYYLERFMKDKGANRAVWLPDLGVAEINKAAGNYWRTTGYAINARCFLYPEEALFLLEEKKIVVEENGVTLSLQSFYERVLGIIPLPCYLTYLKLKSLDYIIQRHKKQIGVFSNDHDVFKRMKQFPDRRMLDEIASFDIFVNTAEWSKNRAVELKPAAFVVVTTGAETFLPNTVLELLQQAGDIPLLFAVVSPSGFVILHEFTNAEVSLDWSDSPSPQKQCLLTNKDPSEDAKEASDSIESELMAIMVEFGGDDEEAVAPESNITASLP